MKLSEAAYYTDKELVECPHCNGEGYTWSSMQYSEEDFDHKKEFCYTCDGKGEVTKRKAAWLKTR